MIRLAKEKQIRLVVVEMPLPSKMNRRYQTSDWAEYRKKLSAELGSLGVEYIVASSGIDDRHFGDELHLAPSGAALFSKQIAELLH